MDHPDVARDLNNLAALLQAAKRLAEAEPLMHRGVGLLRKFGEATGYEHPNLRAIIMNYWALLEALGASKPEIEARVGELLRPGASTA
jgi:hypothetical protein